MTSARNGILYKSSSCLSSKSVAVTFYKDTRLFFHKELLYNYKKASKRFKLQLHDAIYRLRFYSNSLTHILSLSNSHNNVASIQKNRGDKSHRVIVA